MGYNIMGVDMDMTVSFASYNTTLESRPCIEMGGAEGANDGDEFVVKLGQRGIWMDFPSGRHTWTYRKDSNCAAFYRCYPGTHDRVGCRCEFDSVGQPARNLGGANVTANLMFRGSL